MRHYGDSYADSLNTDISSVRFSVDTTSYSSRISAQSVNSNRQGIKLDCLSAANSAYDRVYLIRSKLDHLRSVLSTFYGEVETTGGSINSIATSVCGVLSDVNTSLTNLHDVLAEVGSYRGTTATPAAIDDACAPLTNAGVTLASYYATTFTNPDGSLDYDAISEYCDEYDLDYSDGVIDDPTLIYRQAGLGIAVFNRFDNCSSPEEFEKVMNDLLGIFYVQDYSSRGDWLNSNTPSYITDYDENGNPQDRLAVYYNYSFRPSAVAFSNLCSSTLSYGVDDQFYADHYYVTQFGFSMEVIATEMPNISIPVYVDGDWYEDYRIDHYVGDGDPSNQYGEGYCDWSTSGDTSCVQYTFPGLSFTFDTDENGADYLRIGGRTDDYGFILPYEYNESVNGYVANEHPMTNINLYAYDTDFNGNVLETYDQNSIDFANGQRTDITWEGTIGNIVTGGVEKTFWQVAKAPSLVTWVWFGLKNVGKVVQTINQDGVEDYLNRPIDNYIDTNQQNMNDYTFATNCGGPAATYYTVDTESVYTQGDPVQVHTTHMYVNEYDAQLNLGYNSLDQDNVTVYGTSEADAALHDSNFEPDGDCLKYREGFGYFYADYNSNGPADPRDLSSEELTSALNAYNDWCGRHDHFYGPNDTL